MGVVVRDVGEQSLELLAVGFKFAGRSWREHWSRRHSRRVHPSAPCLLQGALWGCGNTLGAGYKHSFPILFINSESKPFISFTSQRDSLLQEVDQRYNPTLSTNRQLCTVIHLFVDGGINTVICSLSGAQVNVYTKLKESPLHLAMGSPLQIDSEVRTD